MHVNIRLVGNSQGVVIPKPVLTQLGLSRDAEGAGTDAGLEHSDPGCSGLKPLTGPEVCRVVERNGWPLERIHGSHHVYAKPGERKVLSVPVPGNKNLKAGLALRIARDAGIDI